MSATYSEKPKEGSMRGPVRKLTAEVVMEMRARYSSTRITYREIARLHGVSMAAARYAITGKTWSHLPGAVPARWVMSDSQRESISKSMYARWKTEPPKNGLSKGYQRLQRHNEKYPDRCAARKASKRAIRNGSLVKQPCEKCGNPKAHGHHDDYSKPLDVRWLCRRCHNEHHHQEWLKAPAEDYSI